MTVAEIDALLYLPGRRRHNLVRALKIPALSDGWRGSFQELLDRETNRDRTTAARRRPHRRPGPDFAGSASIQ